MLDHQFNSRHIELPEKGARLKSGTLISFYAECQELSDGHCLKICPSYGLILTSGSRDTDFLRLPIHVGIPWHDLPDIRGVPRLWQEFTSLTENDDHTDNPASMSFNRAYFKVAVGHWIEGKCLTIDVEDDALVFTIDGLETSTTFDVLTKYFDLDEAILRAA